MPCRWQKSSRVPQQPQGDPQVDHAEYHHHPNQRQPEQQAQPTQKQEQRSQEPQPQQTQVQTAAANRYRLKLYSSQKTKKIPGQPEQDAQRENTQGEKSPRLAKSRGSVPWRSPPFRGCLILRCQENRTMGTRACPFPLSPKIAVLFLRGCTRVPPVLPFGAGAVWGKP